MKLADLKNLYKTIEPKLGFNLDDINQQTDEWHKAKLGVISGSKCKELLAKPSTQTYKTYIAELVSQVVTQQKVSISAAALDWGNTHEDAARSAYEFYFKEPIVEVPFVYGDESMRYGCSPDGLIIGKDDNIVKIVEIKTTFNPANYVKFVSQDNIKKEHELQCQFNMLVTGAQMAIYAQYEPRCKAKPLHFYEYDACEKTHKEIMERIEMAVNDIDDCLEKFGVIFGSHWE